ncbi:MAG: OmpH family outer membrane protein [Bacteroidota bacterium]
MTKNIFLLLLLSIFAFSLNAQKFGYIDSEYITSKMPEYKKAKEESVKYTEKWTNEIEEKYKEIEKLQRQYRIEEVLLTEEMRQSRLKAIETKENEAREYNNKVFGFEGLLFQKKKELIKPALDLVYKSIEKIARAKQLMFIFDKSSDAMMMLYTDPRHDYSDYVLEDMGLATEEKKDENLEKK